ncbi:hypothetical protein OTSUT76_3729 [Orientia tsutsugamushi str. UT76]|uniref:Uncharacterized protein n=1 Tax=Orientia tsutsugamushi TaxID=784 RepID=A0A2U3RBP3_ORITS|nr:hypothetical protein [Orientia tsutsugamushi]KJV71301.1 hypothetical protein OTSUT76_3729 [Orientia tsutsugamushi str. UT76]SPR10588.1 Uncharacterised protein [Orientia tsutsugamushi]
MGQVIKAATRIFAGVHNFSKALTSNKSTLANSHHWFNIQNYSNSFSTVSTNSHVVNQTESTSIQDYSKHSDSNKQSQLFKLGESEKNAESLAVLIKLMSSSNVNHIDNVGESFVHKIGKNSKLNLLDKYYLFCQLKAKGANFEQENKVGNTVANVLLEKYIETGDSKILSYFLNNTEIYSPNKAFLLSLMRYIQEAGNPKQDEMNLFVKTIENLPKKNILLSNGEEMMVLKLLLSYGLSSSCTLHNQDKILHAAKSIINYYPQALGKTAVDEFIKYIQCSDTVSSSVAQFGVLVIQHLSSDEAVSQRLILDSLAKKYSYADKSKILQSAIEASDSEALNIKDLSNKGNTFLHVLKKSSLQDYHKLIGCAMAYGADVLQNDKGKTILDKIDLKSYDDQLLMREITSSGCLDKLCTASDAIGKSLFQKAIKFMAKGKLFILPEIKNAILEFNPSQALSSLAEMCNNRKVDLKTALELIQDLSTKTDLSNFVMNCSHSTLKEISKLPYWHALINSLEQNDCIASLTGANGKLYPLLESTKETELSNVSAFERKIAPSVPEALDIDQYFLHGQNLIVNDSTSENVDMYLPTMQAIGQIS